MSRRLLLTLILVFTLQGIRSDGQAPSAAQNPNRVSPVEFVIDPPTLINLGFEWFVLGDENRNATVAVSYRKKGETAWKSETTGTPQNTHWRNNLMLGQNTNPTIFSVTTNTNYTSSDYNGFRPNPGAPVSFRWSSPPFNVAMIPFGPGPGQNLENREYATLAEYSKATGQDAHSILVDYDIFTNVRRLDAQDISTLQKLYKAEDFDFRLKPGSAAVDRGTALPNVTDGFSGNAPDLGALEVGAPVPRYGPRS
jgi:hypothetical protein